MVSVDFETCEQAVRKHDPDRFFAILFAPEAARPHLFALAAAYYEIAHATSTPHDAMLADIRLAWWRETIERSREGRPRDHAVARALTATFAAFSLPEAPFAAMIAARSDARDGFADASAAKAHADATAGSLMRLMGCVLGGEADFSAAAIAYGLAGRRDLPPEFDADGLAKTHLEQARRLHYPRTLLPAVLPATLVSLYLKRPDPPQWKKQIAYLAAALRGRI